MMPPVEARHSTVTKRPEPSEDRTPTFHNAPQCFNTHLQCFRVYLSGVLDGWCEEVGRDPAEIERSITVVNTEQMEAAEEYVKAGITHLVMRFSGPSYDLASLAELITWRDGRRSTKASSAG
jgi:hypothetical protein